VATGAQLEAARSLVRDLPAADNVVSFALRLVRGTRPADETAPAVVREWIKWGAGPRAGQALLLGAKALALIDGRSVPSPEDVRAIAAPVLRHRLLLNFQAEADGIDTDHVVTRLLEQIAP
jgi:MoxR-like ATPase